MSSLPTNDCLRVAVLSLEPEMSESWYLWVLAPMAALRDRVELLLGARQEGCKVSIDPQLIDRGISIVRGWRLPAPYYAYPPGKGWSGSDVGSSIRKPDQRRGTGH
jgi:hypothetical protein